MRMYPTMFEKISKYSHYAKFMGMIAVVLSFGLCLMCPVVSADSGPTWLNTTFDNVSYTEQQGWKNVDTNVTVFSNTDNFANGYLEISISDATSSDEFRLTDNGLLTVSGSAVYWDGERIGTINSSKDGSDGVMRIDFTSSAALPNANFETGDLSSWIVNNSYTGVNGQDWVENPADDPDVTTADSDPTIDDHSSVSQSATVQTSIKNEGSYALKLTISGTVSEGYGTAHGPMIVSAPFAATAGDSLSLNWNAASGGDWYDVYGFIFNDSDNDGFWDGNEDYQKLFHDVGDNTGGWITTNATINSSVAGDNVRFLFLNGNYDRTGGQGIGSSLYIDGITLEINTTTSANNSIMSSIIENIEFNNSHDDPGTLRTCTLSLKDSGGSTGFNTAVFNFTTVDTVLTLDNVAAVTIDWGEEFNFNHSALASYDPANSVVLGYNVSWIPSSTLGTINPGDTKWSNQTLINNTPQDVEVFTLLNTTTPLGTNASTTFALSITKRDIDIVTDPVSSQTVERNSLFWINGSVKGEYNETFIGNAVLQRNGANTSIPIVVTDGNASFNSSESLGGTYAYTILFYNDTHYIEQSSSGATINVNFPPDNDDGVRVRTEQGQPAENVKSTDSELKFVLRGNRIEFAFPTKTTPVEGIGFDAQEYGGAVVASVQVLKNLPEDVSEPSANQYEMMNINVGKDGMFTSDNSDNLVINFKVSWDWIRENGIDPSTIRLSRYHDEWLDLPTSQVEQDDEFIYFVAQTPGFSIFSIVGDELAVDEPEEEPVVVSEPVQEEAEDKNSPFVGWFGILIVTAVVAIVTQRKNKGK